MQTLTLSAPVEEGTAVSVAEPVSGDPDAMVLRTE